MFTRLLPVAFCLVATPAFATVLVQEGDSYDVLEVGDDELLMTGGSINQLVLLGLTEAVIEGGVLGANTNLEGAILMTADDHLTIRGGTIRTSHSFPDHPGWIRSQQGQPVLTLEGTYFRMASAGLTENNVWGIQGWLADGSFLHVLFQHGLLAANVTIDFNFVPGEIPQTPGDTNYDDVVDLEDLNNVRNNFDRTGLGDSNGDGIVDLEDLNLVRNNFGRDPWFTFDDEVPRPTAVPEPPTFAVAVLLAITMASLRTARK